MNLTKTIKDIKDLKIQGAENVAIKGTEAYSEHILSLNEKNFSIFIDKILKTKQLVLNSRPTEPALYNSVNYLVSNIKENTISEFKKKVEKRSIFIKNHFKESKINISDIGSKKIHNGDSIYTHCHSGTVTAIIKKAYSKDIKLTVNNTETRPLYQGRITAKELADYGIKVNHYIDSAMRLAIKNSDIVLIGADAISSYGQVINKIGSELVCETANKYDIPVYICTNSWKLDTKSIYGEDTLIEVRSNSEIWDVKNKNINIQNYAFEKIDPNLITGIISEIGIYKPYSLIEEVKIKYPYLFKN